MAIRISVLSVPAFMHGGLEVNERWSAFPDHPTERQRATLRDFHGRFIQVHAADRDKLVALKLAFVDEHEKLVEVTAPAKKPDPPAKKSDDKK